MTQTACTHIAAISDVKHAKQRECEECVKIGSAMGAPSDVPGMRPDVVLR